jgi:hypothetical protein
MTAVDDAFETMARNLEDKTGKSLASWVEVGRGTGAVKHGELVKALKGDHGLTHGYANFVAHAVLQSSAQHAEGDDLIAAQYGGAKAALRAIYYAVLREVQAFGGDVDIAPKKAYVSVRRLKQFAILQPSTATRLDVGINFKGVPPGGRLEASGSFNAMVSHRVRLATAADVDAELVGWLRAAYDKA